MSQPETKDQTLMSDSTISTPYLIYQNGQRRNFEALGGFEYKTPMQFQNLGKNVKP